LRCHFCTVIPNSPFSEPRRPPLPLSVHPPAP
jgi:hypothetical protein